MKPKAPAPAMDDVTWQMTRSDLPYVFAVSPEVSSGLDGATSSSLADQKSGKSRAAAVTKKSVG